MALSSRAISSRSLEPYYHIDGDELERQYKEHLSDFKEWDQREHAKDWILFPENLGPHITIDETALSKGELYTIVLNKDAKGRNGSIIAIINGVSFAEVSDVLMRIPEKQRAIVEDITLDLSSSMRKIVGWCFPTAKKIRDRFHVQRLALEALQQIRIKCRWEAIEEDNKAIKAAKKDGKYEPQILSNGDTKRELLVRSRYALYKSPNDWSQRQKERVHLVFELYPEIKDAFLLAHGLRCIYSKQLTVPKARLSLARWYNNVEQFNKKYPNNTAFKTIMETISNNSEEILAFFLARDTNAAAESFNAKLKAFRRTIRGVIDIPFFFYRIKNIYA